MWLLVVRRRGRKRVALVYQTNLGWSVNLWEGIAGPYRNFDMARLAALQHVARTIKEIYNVV